MKWIKAEDLLAARFHLEKDYPKITPPGVDPEVYMRGWNDALEAAADHAEERPEKEAEWVPIDNGLPPVQVWVAVKNRETKDVAVMRIWDAGLPGSVWWEDSSGDLSEITDMVAPNWR